MSDISISQLIQESILDTAGMSRDFEKGRQERAAAQKPSFRERLSGAGNWIKDKASSGYDWSKGKANAGIDWAKSHPKTSIGTGLGTAVAAGAGAYALHRHHKNNTLAGRLNSLKNRGTKFAQKNKGKIAGGAAAALGAAVGTKALLRYLRKKKK